MTDAKLWDGFLTGDKQTLDVLLDRHRDQVTKIAGSDRALPLIKEFFLHAARLMTGEKPFVYWLYLVSRRESRFLKTGYLGWDALFETRESASPPCLLSFADEMNRQSNALTDSQMQSLAIKFEDGLWFEERAAHFESIYPSKGSFRMPTTDWLEEWRAFRSTESASTSK